MVAANDLARGLAAGLRGYDKDLVLLEKKFFWPFHNP
jgi:hypothetical protein